jgi:hypothetical protein
VRFFICFFEVIQSILAFASITSIVRFLSFVEGCWYASSSGETKSSGSKSAGIVAIASRMESALGNRRPVIKCTEVGIICKGIVRLKVKSCKTEIKIEGGEYKRLR